MVNIEHTNIFYHVRLTKTHYTSLQTKTHHLQKSMMQVVLVGFIPSYHGHCCEADMWTMQQKEKRSKSTYVVIADFGESDKCLACARWGKKYGGRVTNAGIVLYGTTTTWCTPTPTMVWWWHHYLFSCTSLSLGRYLVLLFEYRTRDREAMQP